MVDAQFSLSGKRVWVAGHRGMVGQAISRRLAREDVVPLIAGRDRMDLRRQAEVEGWMEAERPQVVFLAAAKVGGILANSTFPGQFIYDNLMIEANIIEAARLVGVEKLIFLGSSCIYPKFAAQPITEDSLLTGALEPTNEWYAVAKIAGIKLCQAYRQQYGSDFISLQPTNLYGPGDNFDLNSSHVLPALMRKAHEAKLRGDGALPVWGSGNPRREFLHVDDLADAAVHLAKVYSAPEPVNVGTGVDVTIRELAQTIADVVGFAGDLAFDASKPDGTPRKLLNVDKLAGFGWTASIPLSQGVADTYAWFLKHKAEELAAA